MSEYFFSARQLTVGYDGVPLIHDIQFDLRRGEIVTLIGPNGAGKSTILKSIARQLKLLGGDVFIGGEPLREMNSRALARRMAVMLTERAQPELMTCREVAALGRYPYTGRLGLLTPEDERRVDEALTAVQAAELSDRDFSAISDGQRQRVLLARALCQDPEILILDEPTAFLDIHHKLKLLDILRRLARERGIAVILSLHEIDLAQKLSDRILCVKGDTIARCDTPEAVFQDDFIQWLYGIESGSYDPRFGSVELPPSGGAPDTFVICGGGAGIPVFRQLQRERRPFIAGILHENDVDYALAQRLASQVITEKPFHPIGDEALHRALTLMETCPHVIHAPVPIGPMNASLQILIDRARTVPDYRKL